MELESFKDLFAFSESAQMPITAENSFTDADWTATWECATLIPSIKPELDMLSTVYTRLEKSQP
ncbi:uncharacterized protein NEMAJ01_2252 [Nematocida major]|uniref:uncharacterized protein n=1 Tax=Nematocida major TaxID=1912982 RepID=UPI002007515C|nr:uncharacterized protein NEMAJ01_2252 [Nematocida major]KAH9387356.1 hypothetical protein NEMAJ01_2252 [Nematocida major]